MINYIIQINAFIYRHMLHNSIYEFHYSHFSSGLSFQITEKQVMCAALMPCVLIEKSVSQAGKIFYTSNEFGYLSE
jgi:hypothetical protein